MRTRLRDLSSRSMWVIAFATVAGCPSGTLPHVFVLESSAFVDGGTLPETFAGSSSVVAISPPLFWSEPPAATRELALIVTDEAGRARWTLYGIGPEIVDLPQGIPPGPMAAFPAGARQGLNFNGFTGWQGLTASDGEFMLFRFTLYALDARLDLEPDLPLEDLLPALEGHIIETATLFGRLEPTQNSGISATPPG